MSAVKLRFRVVSPRRNELLVRGLGAVEQRAARRDAPLWERPRAMGVAGDG